MTCQFCGGACGRVCQGLGFGKKSRGGGEARATAQRPAGTGDRPAKRKTGDVPSAVRSQLVTPAAADRASTSGNAIGERVRKDAGVAPGTRDLTAVVIDYVEAMDRQEYGPSRKFLTEMRAIVGRPLAKDARPWTAEGISERTYYRRKAQERS